MLVQGREEFNEQYNLLTKHFRDLVKEEIRSTSYDNLKTSNKKNSKNSDLIDYKSRLNIISRPKNLVETGMRNLNIGDLESIIVVQGLLIDENNYERGVYIPKNGKGLRFGSGKLLTSIPSFWNILKEEYKYNRDYLCEMIGDADYKQFVNESAMMINNSLGIAKELYEPLIEYKEVI